MNRAQLTDAVTVAFDSTRNGKRTFKELNATEQATTIEFAKILIDPVISENLLLREKLRQIQTVARDEYLTG